MVQLFNEITLSCSGIPVAVVLQQLSRKAAQLLLIFNCFKINVDALIQQRNSERNFIESLRIMATPSKINNYKG
ncbi:hypothetical protein T4D_11815 [Trichinella pseudospiralis]|uniref:Uncharacterized protein n=1 Tax=Trichinella pseudospiralis TaxID=6337 RepID=A0A0V1G571_TRIPS|nr:hypothetical protein T4D_11815 [Trichinella pseudospiralis]